MSDPRHRQLADLLTRHSTRLEPGDRVLIEASHIPPRMLTAMIEATVAAGAHPLIDLKDSEVLRGLLLAGDLEQLEARVGLAGELEQRRMEQVQAYIGLRGSLNISELADVPPERMALYEKRWLKPVHFETRVKKTRWVVLRWPTPSMAQQAGLSTESFEEFFFRVCLADYAAMARAVVPLKERMEATDEVRILGPGTDLRFSIRGMKAIPCCGEYNIPDGECFTAPVRDSVEGVIQFNTPTVYRGTPFDQIRLVFREGRVVEASSSNTRALEEILDSDEGARSLGEFAIAFHPMIERPMRDILFDEKIRGSLHLALGQCYEEAENGNRSAVHWDLVLLQEPGGELWFDGELVRKDGLFLPPDLQALNPDQLLGPRAGG